MELVLRCYRKDEDTDNYFIHFVTKERLQLFGAQVKVKLTIDKEHAEKFNPDRYTVSEEYKINIEI